MRPLPTDNQRPAILLAVLSTVAITVLTLTLTFWVQYRSVDRGYTTELRGALRKYGSVVGVPQASITWLARVHERTSPQVKEDLTSAATSPSAFDFDAPLHEAPGLLVQGYLDHGFFGLWLLLTLIGLIGVAPLMVAVSRKARAPRRRPESGNQGWS